MPPKAPYTTGSPNFQPSDLFDGPKLTAALAPLSTSDLRSAILTAFSLPASDTYTYHAIASVTLSQVQAAIGAGRANGLHAWYPPLSQSPSSSSSSTSLPDPPPRADTDAYIALFSPSANASNTLRGFAANAKKGSLRGAVASRLLSTRVLDPKFTVPKRKKPHPNPAFEFWAWSCRELEWAGPTEGTARVAMAHHVLPVFMHHFGCVVPSYEALQVLRLLAAGRRVLDVGSGNGYWTEMLRREGVEVLPVDSGQSEYRTVWVPDTLRVDGVEWLRRRQGGKGEVLLCVYPVTEGGFTARLLKEYQGDAICIAGTQNSNGYTGFKGESVEAWIARELKGWTKTVQIPLPSFAGKDEALFVFEKQSA